MTVTPVAPSSDDSLWPDLALFVTGLVFAAWYGWDTGHLVWGLWLASLLVGYGILVSSILRGKLELGDKPAKGLAGFFSAVFLLAFFTVHFGGFHWGHSQFLNLFFPVEVDGVSSTDMLGWPQYRQVFINAWWFVLLALFAERRLLFGQASGVNGASASNNKADLMAPYRNVIRLHLLIFFFAFSQLMSLPAVLIYVVVYAVYFFPWSRLRRRSEL